MPTWRDLKILVEVVPNSNRTMWSAATDYAGCDLDCRTEVGRLHGCDMAHHPVSRKKNHDRVTHLFRMTKGREAIVENTPGDRLIEMIVRAAVSPDTEPGAGGAMNTYVEVQPVSNRISREDRKRIAFRFATEQKRRHPNASARI